MLVQLEQGTTYIMFNITLEQLDSLAKISSFFEDVGDKYLLTQAREITRLVNKIKEHNESICYYTGVDAVISIDIELASMLTRLRNDYVAYQSIHRNQNYR